MDPSDPLSYRGPQAAEGITSSSLAAPLVILVKHCVTMASLPSRGIVRLCYQDGWHVHRYQELAKLQQDA